uniref:RING-CH-type domain-containing protein n=1 Tax=Compsopogon caeruleus TaxID=31354 RepID=A0A7S1XG55_9RHOD|mmetsp:Transcript_8328/g.16977  ORF Transcript_8328/g.16977 Transcript_8328/m.16977 type:complete len:170 (+) Transcript_8328:162-671(+)
MSSSGELAMCRICHDDGERRCMVRPCDCSGSLAYVHRDCIEKWLKQRSTLNMYCEICGFAFKFVVRTKSLWAFLLSGSSWQEWFHVGYILFMARRIWKQTDGLANFFSRKARRRGNASTSQYVLFVFFVVHYIVFLWYDLKNLLSKYRLWRIQTAEILVFDKDGEPVMS